MEDESSIPLPFRCPISMELMQDPVTISTGVSYDRRNIERWLFTFNKTTCPATMQTLTSLEITPNLTLRRLIASWSSSLPSSSTSSSSLSNEAKHRIPDLLQQIKSAPFKLAPLRSLRDLLAADDEAREELPRSGAIEILSGVMLEVLEESGEFENLEACEEAVAILQFLPPRNEEEMVSFFLKKGGFNSIVFLMQRGSSDARLHAILILRKMVRTSWEIGEQGMETLCTSLTEILSDEMSTKMSVVALDVLGDVLATSKKAVLKAVEAGAVCLAIELLPEASNHKCEKLLFLLKLMCKYPEGRAAFADHALGVAAVSKKIMRVSELATKLAVKVLFRLCGALPSRWVLEEMVLVGAVKKMVALLHVGGRSSAKHLAIRTLKLHAGVWQLHPCFPSELKNYLEILNTKTTTSSDQHHPLPFLL